MPRNRLLALAKKRTEDLGFSLRELARQKRVIDGLMRVYRDHIQDLMDAGHLGLASNLRSAIAEVAKNTQAEPDENLNSSPSCSKLSP